MNKDRDPPQSAVERSLELQASLLARTLSLSNSKGKTISTAKELLNELRAMLVDVTVLEENGRLNNSMEDIWSLLKLMAPADALGDPTQRKLSDIPVRGARYVLLGAGRSKTTNFDRDPDVPHFRRFDGAWFEFRLIVEEVERGKPLEILSYGYEIRFPGKAPAWVRFDLNLPGHDNADDGLRSHFHPGTEDWSVPSPVLTPHEALDMMLWYMCEKGDRKSRASW